MSLGFDPLLLHASKAPCDLSPSDRTCDIASKNGRHLGKESASLEGIPAALPSSRPCPCPTAVAVPDAVSRAEWDESSPEPSEEGTPVNTPTWEWHHHLVVPAMIGGALSSGRVYDLCGEPCALLPR